MRLFDTPKQRRARLAKLRTEVAEDLEAMKRAKDGDVVRVHHPNAPELAQRLGLESEAPKEAEV